MTESPSAAETAGLPVLAWCFMTMAVCYQLTKHDRTGTMRHLRYQLLSCLVDNGAAGCCPPGQRLVPDAVPVHAATVESNGGRVIPAHNTTQHATFESE